MKTNQLLEFKFLHDLVWYEGSIISLGLTQDDLPVLEIWCDTDSTHKLNIYGYAFIEKEDFIPFINNEKSYLTVLKDAVEIIVFKYDGHAYDFHIMNNTDFISHYGPTEDVDLEEKLLEYKILFQQFQTTI